MDVFNRNVTTCNGDVPLIAAERTWLLGRVPVPAGAECHHQEQAGGQRGTLIIDLNRVTFIDSADLGALVGTARRAAAHGGSLHAVCAQRQTRQLLWMTGVDRRIPLAVTVEGALMFQAASRDSSGSGT